MSASSSQINIPAPQTATQAGATDPDGNLQPLLVDADGALITSGGASGGNPSVSPTGDPVPADATFIGGTDGTDLRGIKVDAAGELQVDVLSSALPSGAATEATLSTLNGKVPSGLTVTSTRLLVDASGTIQPVSGTVTVIQPTGTSLHAVIDSGAVEVSQGTATNLNATVVQPTGSNLHVAVDSMPTTTVTGTVAATQSGTWTVQPGNTANTTAWLVTQQPSSSATLANVNDQATSTTLLASNSARRGATIFNDSTASLYVKFGATASATSFTVLIPPQGYYELPANPSVYTGIIDGIWSADASGAARTTEW